MTDRQPGACPLFNHDRRLPEERLRLAELIACERIFLLNLHARMANLAEDIFFAAPCLVCRNLMRCTCCFRQAL